MITLPSHTSNVFQPLNVSYFKSFKTTFKKVKDAIIFRNNHMELNKITLARWKDQALRQSFTKKLKFGFKTTSIWPFNPKAIDSKTQPLEIYIVANISNQESANNYTTYEEIDHNQYWGARTYYCKTFACRWNGSTNNN